MLLRHRNSASSLSNNIINYIVVSGPMLVWVCYGYIYADGVYIYPRPICMLWHICVFVLAALSGYKTDFLLVLFLGLFHLYER